MKDIELPLPQAKRKPLYRFFEILPALLSYGAIILLVTLSLFNPLLAALYLLIIIITTVVKAAGIGVRTMQGYNRLKSGQTVRWQERLDELNRVFHNKDLGVPEEISAEQWRDDIHQFHVANIENNRGDYIDPSSIYNAVIIATYNESIDILRPTLEAVKASTYDHSRMIVVIAYEERGGSAIEATVKNLQKEFADDFYAFHIFQHPDKVPGEVSTGKGGNITHAGRELKEWLKTTDIDYPQVIVTTLDSDNRPHEEYFSYVAYEYVTRPDRLRLSFQPIALFMNNIWDVPAPMRVIATGNSFWNIISSMRPHMLRNFASHSQGMDALVKMDFWSVRTIVEDGHQFWRSFFYFDGNYSVVPIYVPIYQDAVLSSTYIKTLKAQFKQLRRWAYGASDVPYVAVRLFTRKRRIPFFYGFTYFSRLLDSHVTLACVPLLVAFGGWVPLFLNQEAARSIVAHELPEVISYIQRVAMIGILITVFLTFKMLPPRPERYKRHRSIWMLLQWVLMPITSIIYSALAAFNAQTHLALGKYLDKFDVTDKVVKKGR